MVTKKTQKQITDTFTRIDPTKLAANWRAGLTAYATDPVVQQFMRAGLASRAAFAACAWDGECESPIRVTP